MTAKDTAAVSGTWDLQRTSQSRHVQLITVGEAIGTGLLMDSGKTIATAGPLVPSVYIIIGAVLSLFMRAMGEPLLSDSRHTASADIARDFTNPWAGFVTGWAYWICWVVTGVANMVAIIGYIRFWWPTTPAWVPIMVMTALLLILNAMTVKAFGETEFWFTLVKIIAILVLVFVGAEMVLMGTVNEAGTAAAASSLWSHGDLFPKGVMGSLGDFQIALFVFVGIGLVGTIVAETASPVKTLPKTINSIPIRVMLLYVVVLAVIMMVTP